MRKSVVLFIVSAMIVSAPWAWAQRSGGRGRFGGGMGLLAQKSVQDELKLSADQVKQVDEFLAKQRESFSGTGDLSREERQKRFAESAKASQAALTSILKDDQIKRFKQISIQQRGAQALEDPEVAGALALTDEQKSKIGEIQTAAREEMRSLFQGADAGNRDEMRKKFAAARAVTNEKLLGVLTPEQQTRWKDLAGEPFKGEIRPPFGGGNRGQGGGGNRQRRNQNNDASTKTPGANQPADQTIVRLTGLREDGDESHDDDAKDKKSDDKKSDAQKSKADKARKPKAKKPSGDARHRSRPGRDGFGPRPDFSRGPRSQRDRAWDHVERAIGHRPGGPGSGSMAHRGPGRHGHGPGMHGRPTFGGQARHHAGSFASFRGHRGPGEGQYSFAGRGYGPRMGHFHHRGQYGHHGPMMAHHRGHHGHHGPMMAHHRGHHGPPLAHRPHHHGPPPHMMARMHHHGPQASFAGHRGPGHMHQAGFKKHGPHGRLEAGKHGHSHCDDRSSHQRRDEDDRDDDKRKDD
ncbi:MAG: hypothetical protein WDZ48_07650 [Pirellulales bacterium]